ncbi:hypothetical protein BKA70DRAFT_1572506 [Coprinopsis sp. MPI-PUGE-AT-0042]|nr:hypothetical protein BKA70DRAFT_1572506 [Coprinopsis sp. MPI-PUGE-AT-0042]
MSSRSTSTVCTIPGNHEDGIHIAIYVQNLLCLFLTILALHDGRVTQIKLAYVEVQTTTALVLAFAILISSIVQARTLGMSSHHGTFVLLMSGMNNANTFAYFILYIHGNWIQPLPEKCIPFLENSKCEDAGAEGIHNLGPDRNTWRKAKFLIKHFALVLGSLLPTLVFVMGIWLWSDPLSFGVGNRHPEKFGAANDCALNAGLVAILGQHLPLHAAALRTTSLVIYTLFLVPGVNILMPMALFLSMYVERQRWNQIRMKQATVNRSQDTVTMPSSLQGRFQVALWRQSRKLLMWVSHPICAFLAKAEGWLKGHAFVLHVFLQQWDAYAEWTDSRGYTPLLIAAELGNEDAIQMLLKRNDTQPNAVDGKGSTALILASKEGREAERTAWDWALDRGNASTLEVFLEHAAVNVNQVDSGGLTPLMRALKLRHIAVVRMLLGRRDIQLSGTESSGKETSIYTSKADLLSCVREILKLPDMDVDWEDLCGTGDPQSSPSASLDGKGNAWLSENAFGIEETIQQLSREKQPVAHALVKGIYPRLSLLTLMCVSLSNPKQWGALEALRVQCETTDFADQILYHHSVKDMLQDLLDECLDSVELRLIAGIVMSIDVQHLAVRTLQMLADPDARRRCLSVAQAGQNEQALVDVLHALLNIDNLKPFRPVFLRGLLRFAKATGKFPRALIYSDMVVVESGTPITSGAFGDVWRGVLQGQSIAMKVMRTIKRPEEILRNYSKEAVVWSQLRHPNVLPFYGIYCWAPHDGMPLERMALPSPWLDAGNAVDYLHHHPDVDKEPLILDIAQGLNYLHTFQPAIIHGDLKGNNILINSEGRACLANYGLSKLVRDDACAPELLFWELDQDERETSVPASPPPKTTESDVYVFGCLYTGKPRFLDLSMMARLLAVRGNKKCRKPSDMSNKLWGGVEACWSTLAQERPTMARFIESLGIKNDTEADLEYDYHESSSEDLVWDGRPSPHMPFDMFQLTLGPHVRDQQTRLTTQDCAI